MSNPNPPAFLGRAPRWLVGLGAIALIGYAFFLAQNTTVAAGGSDSSGYLNSARLLAEGRLQGTLRVPPEFGPLPHPSLVQFTPHGFFPYPDNPQLPPTYPPGLPLHLALAGKLFGWTTGPFIIELGGALAAVWLCYLVAREVGLSPGLAVAGAAALAVCPVFLFTSFQPLSDTLATTWCLAAVFFALRAPRAFSCSFRCGLAFSIAVLIRPTNIFLLPALLVLLGLNWRRLLLFGLGGIPAALWLGYYNHALYGGPFHSGYGDWKLSFAASYFAPTIVHFGRWLLLLLPGILLLTAIAAPFFRGARSRILLALALWFGPITALYACYNVSHEVWWCLRFILPAIPALILAGLVGISVIAETTGLRAPRFRAIAAGVVIAWAVGASWYWSPKLGVRHMKGYENAYAEAAIASRTHVPPEALVVGFHLSGALYFYTPNAVLRWDLTDAARFERYAALARQAGRPVFALLFDVEEKSMRERCPGDWVRVTVMKNIGLWRLNSSGASVP